jgi:hypothetical protein
MRVAFARSSIEKMRHMEEKREELFKPGMNSEEIVRIIESMD